MINKTSNTFTLYECMELVFKLNYQVQQLELYAVNCAYLLFCSAQGKMGKMQSLAELQEAMVLCEWPFCLAQERDRL